MKTIPKIYLITFIFFSFSIFISCEDKKENQTEEKIEKNDVDITEKIEQTKKFFYSLPAPIEVASFLVSDSITY